MDTEIIKSTVRMVDGFGVYLENFIVLHAGLLPGNQYRMLAEIE